MTAEESAWDCPRCARANEGWREFCGSCPAQRGAAPLGQPVGPPTGPVTARPAAGTAKVWKLLFGVGVLAMGFVTGAVAVDRLLGEDWAGASVEGYITGSDAEEFFAPDGRFRATFPTQPERSSEALPLGGGIDVPLTMYMSEVENVASQG